MLDITPETKLHALLQAYPQLEEKLLNLSPAFAKLRNPVLRATVAKVATLRQVAQVGGLPLATLINALREAAGQRAENYAAESGSAETPGWFDGARITQRLDARAMLAAGEHPLNQVLSEIQTLQAGEIYELITPFLPAPLLDAVRRKGYAVWSVTEEAEVIKNYFTRA